MAFDTEPECCRQTLTLETDMHVATAQAESSTAIRVDLCAIFVSLELSRSKWLVTTLLPDGGGRMSKREVEAGASGELLALLSGVRAKVLERTGMSYPVVVIQEAGLDGFWIHRLLEQAGMESHVVDPASVAVSRRRRRAKTDRIDGEALIRTLLAWKRGEPRVCAMVRAPTAEAEDRRRITRERKVLLKERIGHVNRIKGLLFGQGISGYAPLRRDRRARLAELVTGDGRPLPAYLTAQIGRELDRVELLLKQIAEVDAARDALVAAEQAVEPGLALLLGLRGIGNEFGASLWMEGLARRFANRRQLAAYAGLAPTPWQSGRISHEQGVSKAGNPRLRTMMIQLAWLWLKHQPASDLSTWFRDRVKRNGGRLKKATVVALARKLLVALWKYVQDGVVIEKAVLKPV